MAVMSIHASVRAQQRSIPPAVIDWLFQYGSSTPQNGAEIIHFDKSAKARMGRALGSGIVGRLGNLLSTYAVVADDGAVVTIGYRNRRIRRR